MDLSNLQKLLRDLAGVRILAVGDVMVDRFIYGTVARVSAEAPIPVLARVREDVMLGAAGNVARNIAALGGNAALIGVVGNDGAAHEALALVGEQPRIEGFLITDSERPTTVKTRYVSAGQQLLRVDLESTEPVSGEVEARLARTIVAAANGAQVILLSDYGKGVVSPTVIAACHAAAKAEGALLIVDSKARGFARYGAADVVKPNAAELAFATDMPTGTDLEVEKAIERGLELCECGAILVTRAEKGMSLAVRGQGVRHFRRPPREVFDTAGAGDTALAAIGLALASGASMDHAAGLALLASSLAIEKAGTATISPDELVEAELSALREPFEAKIATADRMVREVRRWRDRGLKVGFTNGCFDILHPGHIAYLSKARTWCDRLIVAVNSDRSVNVLKGVGRPINSLESRAFVLAGLAFVDLVVSFDEETPRGLIELARPDILIKGSDYTIDGIVGRDIVTAYGGEVRLAPLVQGYSTTETLRRAAGAK